jgi:hypothetical protein
VDEEGEPKTPSQPASEKGVNTKIMNKSIMNKWVK